MEYYFFYLLRRPIYLRSQIHINVIFRNIEFNVYYRICFFKIKSCRQMGSRVFLEKFLMVFLFLLLFREVFEKLAIFFENLTISFGGFTIYPIFIPQIINILVTAPVFSAKFSGFSSKF